MVLPHTSIGPYRLVRQLGEGGMGEVYEALHETIKRQVAIKVLRPQFARNRDINRRFVNEARAVNLINHPGLVQISDIGQLSDGSRYIVMEYLRGETLGQRCKRLDGQVPLAQALHIIWQVASALVAAHEKGVTHRDLKPDNIMLVPDAVAPTGERAKLLDFGIARLDEDLQNRDSLTRSHIMGTPTYMSPEQCRGSGSVGSKSDVYSLGVVFYQLLAGRPPFVAQGMGEVISMHLSQLPPPLPEFAPLAAPELVELVHKLLHKDPEQRPTMQEVVAELEQLQARQGSAGALPPIATPEPPRYPEFFNEKPSDSQANLLSQPAEQERSQPVASDGRTPVMAPVKAVDPTLGWGPRATQEVVGVGTEILSPQPSAEPPQLEPDGDDRQPFDLARQPAVINPLTVLTGGNLTLGTGESLESTSRPRALWSLALAALLGGIAVAVAAWLWHPQAIATPVTVATQKALPVDEALRVTPGSEVAAAPLISASPPAPVPPAVKPLVHWLIDSKPAGAIVVRADTGQVLGTTPWQMEQPGQAGSFAVWLRYPGFADQEVLLDRDRSSSQQQRLSRLPARALGPRRAIKAPNPGQPAPPAKAKSPDAPSRPQFEVIE